MSTRPADSITDFAQFQGLRAGARKGDEAAVTKAAQQFEALFTQQLFKSMRAGALGDDVMGGGQSGFYQDLFDQQMAVHLSSGKGLGLADMLVRQLRASGAMGDTTDASPSAKAGAAAGTSKAVSPHARITGTGSAATAAADAGTTNVGDAGTETTPEAFVQAILPHAERAARELGVPARVLIAQAALETGWGKHAIKDDSGASSYNFFGIKADRRWDGEAATTTTTEYVDGSERRERADFRAYDSAGAAFDDYVDFLKSNPRYAEALRHGGSATRFVQSLQKAGYASDPAYAQKVLKIAGGPTLQLALAAAPRRYSV